MLPPRRLSIRYSMVLSLAFLCACAALSRAGEETLLLNSAGASILVVFPNPPPEPLRQEVKDWITKASAAVSHYYQRYPVPAVKVTVNVRGLSGINSGRASGWNGANIAIAVGRATKVEQFNEDWIMTHEMVHLAFPSVDQSHHWIEEGLATYIEPIARLRVGQLTPDKVWGDMYDGMVNGLPETGDRGLDYTPTWGRTYWGGAMFCLFADVGIRERTHNQKGLEDALRAILREKGNIQTEARLTDLLETGDAATGVPVLTSLYHEWAGKPVTPDLRSFWRDLGVSKDGNNVRFDDTARLASIRYAIGKGGP